MATGTYTPDPFEQYCDAGGKPLAGGSLLTYAAGTSTALATYSDVNLSVANGIPPTGIVLDSSGRPQSGAIFLPPGTSYKFILKDSSGNVVVTRDNVTAVPTSSQNQDVTGTAGATLNAGIPVYLSDGSGARTAGLWYPADATNAYSSTLVITGVVPATIASGASGTVRLGGQVTGIGPLVIGLTYYVAIGGGFTSTVPINGREIGQADTTASIIMGTNTNASVGYDFGQIQALF